LFGSILEGNPLFIFSISTVGIIVFPLLELSEDEKECEIEDVIENDNIFFDNKEELKINQSINTKYVNKEDNLVKPEE
jgi:hypothetical protein